MNPQDKPESESTKWGDLAEDDEVDSGASEDNLSKEVEEKLSTKVAPGNEDVDEPLPISVTKGQLLPNQEEDKLIVDQSDPTSPLYSVHSFEELGLAPELLRGVYALGYNKPSRIQEAALPIALGNPPQNLIAQAQSGTGKTAAFTLSMLSRSTPEPYPQALCVCPTRELARQIHSVVSEMGKFSEIKPLLVVRDAPIPKTKITHQIVIGTPGKLLDLLKHRTLDTSRIKVFVLDEADEMLALQGLSPQTLRLKNALPGKGKNCQILLFSATYDDKVAKFAYQVVPKPHVSIRLERKQLSLDKIAQFYIDCGSEGNKFNVLAELYCYLSVGQSIIFVAVRILRFSLCFLCHNEFMLKNRDGQRRKK
ncbi:RNA helicase required for poly(A+) mRNA export [Balamuthia mandrillaris]